MPAGPNDKALPACNVRAAQDTGIQQVLAVVAVHQQTGVCQFMRQGRVAIHAGWRQHNIIRNRYGTTDFSIHRPDNEDRNRKRERNRYGIPPGEVVSKIFPRFTEFFQPGATITGNIKRGTGAGTFNT